MSTLPIPRVSFAQPPLILERCKKDENIVFPEEEDQFVDTIAIATTPTFFEKNEEMDTPQSFLQAEVSKKRSWKSRVTVLEDTKNCMKLTISGTPQEYKTKGAEAHVREIRQAAQAAIQSHTLKGPLKLNITFHFARDQGEEESSSSSSPPLSTTGGDIIRLARFVIAALFKVTHRDSGQFIEIDIKKEFGDREETVVSVEKSTKVELFEAENKGVNPFRINVLPTSFMCSSYMEPSKQVTSTGIDALSCEKQSHVAAMVHQQPVQYQEKYQWKERKNFGAEITKQISSSKDDWKCLKGECVGYFEYGIKPAKSGMKRLEICKSYKKSMIHTGQPNLVQLAQFTIDSLSNVAYFDPQQLTHIRARKTYSDQPKTALAIMNPRILQREDTEPVESLIQQFENITI